MAYTYADYGPRSQRLANAAQQLLDALDDPNIDRSLAIIDLEQAAAGAPASDLARGFESTLPMGIPPTVAETSEDALSAALLELQSANVLVSAGLALGEAGETAERGPLSESVSDIQGSRPPVSPVLRGFEAATRVNSADLESARKTFRTNADGVLDGIVDDAAKVIGEIVEQLKRLDPGKVVQAIEGLGTAIPLVAKGGRLIKQGLEKLKNVISALGKMVGPELFGKAKDKVLDVWNKARDNDYTRTALSFLIQESDLEKRIASAAERTGVVLEKYDTASNEVAALAVKFGDTMKLLRSLLKAVVTAAAILAFVPVAAPYVPAATAGTYALLVAIAIITAASYSGSAGWVRRERSIAQLADGLA
jgi:hypothetical protein